SLMLNTCMNWGNILNQDAFNETAAFQAAKLLDSTDFIESMDSSASTTPDQPHNDNGVFTKPDDRAAGGAEPVSKRARLDSFVLHELGAAPQHSNGTQQDEPEKEYAQLLPVSAASLESAAAAFSPSAHHDIFHEMDCAPSTSATQPSTTAAEEEDEWLDYFYELDDPHPDLIEKVQAQMARSDEEIARLDAQLTEVLIEKATIDQMVTEKFGGKKASKYRQPGTKDHIVYVCFVCSRGFMSTDEMREHIQEAHLKPGSERDFKCRFCRRSFAKKQKMQEHERKHSMPGANFACDKCPAFYNTRDTLERHYSDKHGCRMDGTMIEQKELSCETCGKKFGVKKELQYHKYYCSRKEEILEQRAEKRQAEKMKMAAHVAPCSPHEKIGKDKSCPVCGLVCSSMQSRNRHVLRIHPERYAAVMEAKHVYSPSQAQLAARPYTCAQCDKAFANRAALSTHERRMHGADDSKMYACGKCGRSYPLASELKKHEKRSEGLLMCRGLGRGGVGGSTPSTPGSSLSALSSRASSLAPPTPRAGLSPLVRIRPSSNMAIYEGDASNADEKKGRKRRRDDVKEEGEEEMDVAGDEFDKKVEEKKEEEDDAMEETTLDDEIAQDEARREQEKQYDTLDDFVF
ncbi:hypothetical protein PFISCL1PPCAC_17618, partial [Pristionchus fissidentatus]